MGAEETDTEVPISEMAPRPDPGRQYVGWAGGVLQECEDGGGSRATTTEAGGGADDARIGFGDADGDGAGLAMGAELGAELAGSEFRADVALKDESVGMAMADREELAGGGTKSMDAEHSMEEVAQAMERWPGRWPGLSIEEIKENMDALREVDRMREAAKVFWADVDRRGGDRFWTFGAQQTMAPRGASEQVGKAEPSGRKADEVMYDWNGEAEGALPDVDRPEPVVATAGVEMRDRMDFQAALPMGGGCASI
jgi:hypothetical protein